MKLSQHEYRRRLGERCGWLGVGLNLLLCAFKLVVGQMSSSVSIVGDALNNLLDAGSSLVTLLGFRIAGKAPDREHPYGHGRMEYVSGLLIAVMILFMGFELLRSAVERLLHPVSMELSAPVFAVLAAGVLVKLFMAAVNRRMSRRLHSQALRAAAVDARNDAIATAVVLLCALVQFFTSYRTDACCGLAMGVFILVSGIRTLLDTVSTILGRQPDSELVESIARIAGSHDGVVGVHDIVAHDYGPGRYMASLHVEVAAEGSLWEMHALAEHIEDELEEQLGCRCVIHLDPVMEASPETLALQQQICGVLHGVDPALSLHDFRVLGEGGETLVSFDILAPYDLPLSDDELRQRLKEAVALFHPCRLAIRVDRGG